MLPEGFVALEPFGHFCCYLLMTSEIPRFLCNIKLCYVFRSLMELKLKSGTTLIVDRYSYSGVAFSSAKGLDIEWCKVKNCVLVKKK